MPAPDALTLAGVTSLFLAVARFEGMPCVVLGQDQGDLQQHPALGAVAHARQGLIQNL